MCKQAEVLKKIHKAGKINGFGVELAEAQAMDYTIMKEKITRMEEDIANLKENTKDLLAEQARQGGMIEAIFRHINSPIEEERKNGIVWAELKNIMKTPMGKIIIVLAIGCIGLSGQRILELLGLI